MFESKTYDIIIEEEFCSEFFSWCPTPPLPPSSLYNSNESESENGEFLSDHETSVGMIANVATREDVSHASKHMAAKHCDKFFDCGSDKKK